VVRIAGILHLASAGANGFRDPINAVTVLNAERIGAYYRASAINTFDDMGTDQSTADAVYLLKRIHQTGESELSERDITSCRGGGSPPRTP
jgi:replicative DNA helicase